MEKELPFDFSYYYTAKSICIKPVDTGLVKAGHVYPLGIFHSCNHHSSLPDKELEERFYNGLDRFYFYDIKLCHTQQRFNYRNFMNEIYRRSETHRCAIHFSNSTVRNEFNSITQLYDIPYFKIMLKNVLHNMKSEFIIELSNKRIGQTKPYHDVIIDNIAREMDECELLKHYMIREEIYERTWEIYDSGLKEPVFSDEHTSPILKRELVRYDKT